MKSFVVAAFLVATTLASSASKHKSVVKPATSFWYANMDHTGGAKGFAPDLDGDLDYPVFVAVKAGDGSSSAFS